MPRRSRSEEELAEPRNLELAWEVLEVARLGYSKAEKRPPWRRSTWTWERSAWRTRTTAGRKVLLDQISDKLFQVRLWCVGVAKLIY